MSETTPPPARLRPFQRVYADLAGPVVDAIQTHRVDLELARQDDDPESILAIVGPLGQAYRMLGQLDPAVSYGEEAVALAEQTGATKQAIANGLRLATALQYRNEHARALPLFEAALAAARSHGYLVDFALQHLGKCLVELGRKDEAIACFEEALKLRQTRDDHDLIHSTEEALEGAHSYKGFGART